MLNKMKWTFVLTLVFACMSFMVQAETFTDRVGPTTINPAPAPTGAVQVPFITWGGDVSTFYANGGLTTAKGTIFDQQGIKVQLVPGDNFVRQVQNYMTGKSPFLRGTFRQVSLASEVINSDPRTKGVVVLQLTWSQGDHMVVREGFKEISDLRGKQVYGLSATVSDYAFYRFIQENDPEKAHMYTFTNMDPAAAAINMQQGEERFKAIVVWNPFVINTLAARDDVHVLHDSSEIPNEIIDMVVANRSALERAGGENAAKAIVEAFYECNRLLADPATADDTLTAIGEKFSNLGLDSMRTVVEQTKFYATPAEAIALYEGPELKATMEKVVDFCFTQAIIDEKPQIAYPGSTSSNLTFDTTYIHAVAGQ